jgi:hypothetical protein
MEDLIYFLIGSVMLYSLGHFIYLSFVSKYEDRSTYEKIVTWVALVLWIATLLGNM